MKSPKTIHPILKTVTYFSSLDSNTFETVAQSAVRRVYQTNQLILTEGEPSIGLHIIESGWVKVTKFSFEGREQILNTLGPTDSFNAVSVFTDTPNQASVSALEETVIWLIPRVEMTRLLDKNPTLAKIIIQDLAKKVIHLVGLVEDLSLRSIEERVAKLLLENAEKETLPRRRWATQAEMANRIGTVPDVLNRILRKLVDDQFIQVSRTQIQIIDRQGLEKIAKIE
jgi:CRP-like cAMP-binding protein